MSFANHVSCIYVDSMNTDLYVFTSWNHQSKSMDWFLCDNGLRHERVNSFINVWYSYFLWEMEEFYIFQKDEGQYKNEEGYNPKVVGNKTKGRVSILVLQENKARQIFRKANISYPMIRMIRIRIFVRSYYQQGDHI